MKWLCWNGFAALCLLPHLTVLAGADQPPPSEDLRSELKTYPHKVVFETNRDGNWELYLVNADGSSPVNLTQTLAIDELYPKPSPDGTKIAYVADRGEGAHRVRDVYVANRQLIVELFPPGDRGAFVMRGRQRIVELGGGSNAPSCVQALVVLPEAMLREGLRRSGPRSSQPWKTTGNAQQPALGGPSRTPLANSSRPDG